MLQNPICPACGSERTTLVRPGSPREFAYRCFTCGRGWRIFPAYGPDRDGTAMDSPLTKRMQERLAKGPAKKTPTAKSRKKKS